MHDLAAAETVPSPLATEKLGKRHTAMLARAAEKSDRDAAACIKQRCGRLDVPLHLADEPVKVRRFQNAVHGQAVLAPVIPQVRVVFGIIDVAHVEKEVQVKICLAERSPEACFHRVMQLPKVAIFRRRFDTRKFTPATSVDRDLQQPRKIFYEKNARTLSRLAFEMFVWEKKGIST